MGLQNLKEVILSKAQIQAESIIKEAMKHVEEAKKKEREKIKELKTQAEKDVALELKQYEKEKLLWATLEGNRFISEAKSEAVEHFVKMLREVMIRLKKKDVYKSFLNNALSKGISDLSSTGNNSLVAHVMRGESKLLTKKIKGVVVKEDLDPLYIGGVIVELPDGSIRANMTLDEIINENINSIKGEIYRHLFGNEKSHK